MQESNNQQPASIKRLSLSFDPRIVIGVLLLVIVGMLVMWRPWQTSGITDRTIDVSGEAKVTAEPDEYTFYPSYQYQNADKDAALAEATRKHDEVIRKLKELGVADNKIKSDTSGFTDTFRPMPERGQTTYSSTITIVVGSKELAQKVQDYLVTTSPVGSVSPNATFSEAKRKELETRARDEATKDARAKAEQSAKNLGAKLGKVKSITDGAGFEGGKPMPLDGVRTMQLDAAATSLAVQPGENELNYTVSVTYYIR